jgi:hypothetical protein
MKLAICLYAFLRTYEDTAASLIKHAVVPNNADLFVFAPDTTGVSVIPQKINLLDGIEMDKAKFGNTGWARQSEKEGGIITPEKLRNVYGDALKDFSLYQYDYSFFEAAAQGITPYSNIPPARIFSLFYNMRGAIALCEKFAEKNKIAYDALLLTRGDVALYRAISISGIDLQKMHIPAGGGVLHNSEVQWYSQFYKNVFQGELQETRPFTDILTLSSYENMRAIASIYERLPGLSAQLLPMHPETLLHYAAVLEQGLEVETHKEWIFEVCRTDFARIDNGAARYPPEEAIQDLREKAEVALREAEIRKLPKTLRLKKLIMTVLKVIFYPLKKIVLCTKRFCRWLVRE